VRNKADLPSIAAHIRTVRALRPDIVHVNLYSPFAGQYGLIAGLLARCPVVAVEQIVYGSPTRLQLRLRRLLCTRLSAHVAVGERAARGIEELIGLPHGSVEAIHNGVPDIPLRSVERPRPGPIVGAVGRFSRQKGFDVLIRALAALPDVTGVLVGDGPQRGALERLAEELGVEDRIVITGWVERPRDFLPAFDVVAAPSRFEGFPLAVIEAMLAGRAVVASSVESIPEAIEDGSTGLLVPPDAPEALAQAIRTLLDDPGLREEIGGGARSRALARFTASTMARRYEALYRRMLGEHG
jgi:glycosyltransferase involved in cell wall biosynthesis